MDNLFLEEFDTPINPNEIKEIQIHKDNIFQVNNDNTIKSLEDYDINTEAIIHKQENISENTNDKKIYDISSLYTKEITKERLLISYEDMETSASYVNFNGSYVCDFNLNKTYNNVIGFELKHIIYEYNASYNASNVYMDVIINNIPREACINTIQNGYILKRIPFDYKYDSDSSGSGVDSYSCGNDNMDYFYPIVLNKLNLELRYNHQKIDLLSSNSAFSSPGEKKKYQIGRFSLEFELTILNR